MLKEKVRRKGHLGGREALPLDVREASLPRRLVKDDRQSRRDVQTLDRRAHGDADGLADRARLLIRQPTRLRADDDRAGLCPI